MVRFDKKWFNPLYFILNELIKVNTIRLILVYGGKSSSKTVSIAQVLAKETALKNASTIAFRKENNTIPTTLKKSFNLALKTTRLYPAFEAQDRRYITEKEAEIVLKGLDDEEKAKGIESYKYVYIDELNHFLKSEFITFNISLRGIEGQKIIASWNPVSIDSWIKEYLDTLEFIDTEYKLPCPSSFVRISTDGSVVLIKTTWEDNYWIAGSPDETYGYRDNNLIAVYKELEAVDPNAYRVNVLGEWGVVKPDQPFCYCFDKAKHLKPTTLIRSHEVYLSFDFNVNPITCGVYQHYNNWIYGIESIKLDNSDIYKLCEYIQVNYAGCIFIVTGDATGRATNALVQDGINYYTVIKTRLRLSNTQLKVPTINPRIEENRVLVNSVFHDANIILDPVKCKHLAFDCENVGMNELNEIDKGSRTNPKKRADHLDNFRYYLNSFHKNYLRS
ncbi:MAG: hypothetical protein H0X33_14225 [Taibaiella sp.]|nr:hypothetical protein [Taibaiella sp.]